jgi:hypothetical protein
MMQFPKVLNKWKDSFGNMLEVLNFYLKFGVNDL